MNAALIVFRRYASVARYRRAFYLFLLGSIALIDYLAMGSTSATFVFYNVRNGKAGVETRALPRKGTPEFRAARYVEEALLGSESVSLGRLFPKGTRLESFMIREGIAYLDLSATAALPAEMEVDARRSLAALAAGLERNFGSIKTVRIFIAGHEPYITELAETKDFSPSSKKTKNVDN